jgi:hypothetical protein
VAPGPKNPFDDEVTFSVSAEERAPRPSATAKHAAHAGPVPGAKRGMTGTNPALAQARVTDTVPALPSSGPSSNPALRREEGPRFSSTFDGRDTTRTEVLLGQRPTRSAEVPALRVPTREAMKAVSARFDGMTAGYAVVQPPSRLKPLEPDVSSTPGARDPLLTRVVLDQFAPEVNPRYARGEAGHLFAWDFTHAMGCAVPRFRAGGELTLGQICAWLRTLSADAGWVLVSSRRASELAATGAPVLVLPKTPRSALIAVARPDRRGSDGLPLLASACSRACGSQLTVAQAFGEPRADFYFHE